MGYHPTPKSLDKTNMNKHKGKPLEGWVNSWQYREGGHEYDVNMRLVKLAV